MPTTKRLAAALASVAVAIGGLAVAAAPAHADEWDDDYPCVIEDFSPRTVVVGTSPVVKTFGVSVSNCDMQGWSVEDADGYLFYTYENARSEVIDPNNNSEAGSRDVIVEAQNGDWDTESRVFANGFTLKRNAYWQKGSFNASPEPVKKGKSLTVKGRLKVADWDSDRYVGYGSRTIQIQFRSSTNASWTTMKTTKTSKSGWVNTKVTAKKSGYYRATYGGSSVAGAATSGTDFVKVK